MFMLRTVVNFDIAHIAGVCASRIRRDVCQLILCARPLYCNIMVHCQLGSARVAVSWRPARRGCPSTATAKTQARTTSTVARAPRLPTTPLWRPQRPDELSAVFFLVNAAATTAAGVSGRGDRFTSHTRSSWTDGTAPSPVAGQRWAPELCGARVVECDVRTTAGLQAARAAYAARRPVVLKHARHVIAPDVCAELGDLKRLSALLAGVNVTVLSADRAARGRFTYYHDVPKSGVADVRHRELMAPPQVNGRIIMSWEKFYAALRKPPHPGQYVYMQLALAARKGGIGSDPHAGMATRVSPRLLDQLQRAMRSGPFAELSAGLGPWTVTNLYTGPADTLAPCHWDGARTSGVWE